MSKFINRSKDSRFYAKDGTAVYEIPKKRGDGTKAPNINDAIEMGLVPSVTTVLRTMNKPALNDWLTDQAVMAVLTTPRKDGEGLDDFVRRVLVVEKVQEQYARKAAQLGTDIHDAISHQLSTGEKAPITMQFYVAPAVEILNKLGKVMWTEKVLVGDGYAGRADCLVENDATITLPDFKTTGSKLPEKAAYDEHCMQVAAYAQTLGNTGNKRIQTAVIYISTSSPGTARGFVQEDWKDNYEAFKRLLWVWQHLNGVPH